MPDWYVAVAKSALHKMSVEFPHYYKCRKPKCRVWKTAPVPFHLVGFVDNLGQQKKRLQNDDLKTIVITKGTEV